VNEEAEPANPASADRVTAEAADGSGVDLARAALAQARAAARRRGSGRQRRPEGDAADSASAPQRSGARPDDRDPQRLDHTIDRLLAERGWETTAAVHGVVGRWDEIVGAEVAAHCRPDRFADGVLTVIADSTAWATQVRLLAPQLVRRLNEELGHGTVARVSVLGPAAPTWRKGQRRVTGERGPRDTYG
jgi:predicted nucleic acid-binding Zn ribbon protein